MTPLGWFGPTLVPGCLSPPQMCCFGAGGLSASKWGQLGCRGINIQGLSAWFPLHNHLLSEPRSICVRPCIPPSTLGQFSAPLCPSSCCSSQRQDTSPHLSLFDTFFKSCGFFPLPLINFYLYLMRCTRPLPPSWVWGCSTFGGLGCFGDGWCGREGEQAGAGALVGDSNPSLGGDRVWRVSWRRRSQTVGSMEPPDPARGQSHPCLYSTLH